MNLQVYTDYLIHLIKCAVLNEQPLLLPDGVSLGELFAFAKQHTAENIIYLALKKLNIDDKTMLLFEEFYNHAIINDATQQYYLETVTDALEAQKIRHCIMKGPVIKKLYPSSDMRQSGDLDIFVDDENTEKVRDIMEGLGFTTENFNKANSHDEYRIDKTVIFEIHRSLISNKCPWQKECQKIADRLILTDGCAYRYEMTKEDYYLYMIGHMAKHMKYTGIGIKMVLDVWIYLRAYNDILDWNKLNGFLHDCGLLEFEENIKLLCGYWFDGAEADEKIKKMAEYIALSGNFGTHEQLVAGLAANDASGTESKAVSKAVYYVKIFFMPYKHMREKYPVLKKAPVLLPFCWIHRAVSVLLFNREKAEAVMGRYDNVDLEYGKKLIEFKKEIGL